jgi:hypothetical protein
MYRILLGTVLLLVLSLSSNSQCSTADVATGAPFATTGITGHEGTKAFDADLSTYYSEGGSTQEIGIDMGRDVAICSVELTWGSADYATGYVVRASSDWTNWYTSPAQSHTGSGNDVFYFPNPLTTYRIVEIYVYGRQAGSSGIKLYNFSVHEAASGSNLPPVINLTAPLTNVEYQLGRSVNIMATATDPDGGVAKVEYYVNNNKIGEVDYPGPYNYAWTPMQTGGYAVKAVAIDNLGSVKTSTIANVTITPSAGNSWSLIGNGEIAPSSQFIGTTDAQPMIFKTNNTEQLRIGTDGRIKIGAFANAPADAKLAVDGFVYARKLTITAASWADFVFGNNYSLPALTGVEKYIKKFRHLPGVPSEAEINKQGINVGDNQAILLRKIEELTLYLIAQNKKITKLQAQIQKQEKAIRNISSK